MYGGVGCSIGTSFPAFSHLRTVPYTLIGGVVWREVGAAELTTVDSSESSDTWLAGGMIVEV